MADNIVDNNDVGIGRSPHGRVVVTIEGRSHTIEPADAQWMADEMADVVTELEESYEQ